MSGDNKKREKRRARPGVRYSPVNLTMPANLKGKEYPKRQPVFVAEVKEKAETVPAKEKPIEWRLYTNHIVESPDDAEKVMRNLRFLRTTKSVG